MLYYLSNQQPAFRQLYQISSITIFREPLKCLLLCRLVSETSSEMILVQSNPS